MKILFIGGTGNISTPVSRLCVENDIELWHINRGLSGQRIPGVRTITADISDVEHVRSVLKSHEWDAVVNWIAYGPADIERDFRLFENRTKQYIFISSASCYSSNRTGPITEETPLDNRYWNYSRQKIACERRLMDLYQTTGFPVTIVRPSYTYDTIIPIAIGGFLEFTTCRRILDGKEIIVHDDGACIWTLTHADDFARGFVPLLGHPESIGESIHITSDEALSWNAIFATLGEALGRKPNIVHIPTEFICSVDPGWTGTLKGDKAHEAVFDNTKIKRLASGFKANIPLSEGLKRTIQFFFDHPDRQIVNDETDVRIENVIKRYR